MKGPASPPMMEDLKTRLIRSSVDVGASSEKGQVGVPGALTCAII